MSKTGPMEEQIKCKRSIASPHLVNSSPCTLGSWGSSASTTLDILQLYNAGPVFFSAKNTEGMGIECPFGQFSNRHVFPKYLLISNFNSLNTSCLVGRGGVRPSLWANFVPRLENNFKMSSSLVLFLFHDFLILIQVLPKCQQRVWFMLKIEFRWWSIAGLSSDMSSSIFLCEVRGCLIDGELNREFAGVLYFSRTGFWIKKNFQPELSWGPFNRLIWQWE